MAAVRSGAVVEEEADGDVFRGWEGGGGRDGGVGDELEGHGRGVVWDGGEIGAVGVGVGYGREGGEIGETEEGLEGAVGAELDVDFRGVG